MGKRVKETVAMEISLSQKFGLIIRLKPFVMYVALGITKDKNHPMTTNPKNAQSNRKTTTVLLTSTPQ